MSHSLPQVSENQKLEFETMMTLAVKVPDAPPSAPPSELDFEPASEYETFLQGVVPEKRLGWLL